MDVLARAIAIAAEMRLGLEAEVARAREQRLLIKKLDTTGLFAGAQARGAFNLRLAELEAALAAALRDVATLAGLKELTLADLRALPPRVGDGRELADGLTEVQALAAALHELDGLNRLLAERAMACVRGYFDAVAPRTSAYDRRGAVASGPAYSTSSRMA